MWRYQALIVLHLLFVILWLGPDLVSWYVAWIVRRPRFELSDHGVFRSFEVI